jgi:toxin ParE1/3/4
MSLPVIVTPEAEVDIDEIRDQLSQQHSGLEVIYLARLRELLDRIEQMPEMYATIWNEVRAARTARFPFVLYYHVLSDHVEVIAVMHGSRDWSAWQSRV